MPKDKPQISVELRNGAIDMVFVMPGKPSVGIRLPIHIAQAFHDALNAELLRAAGGQNAH